MKAAGFLLAGLLAFTFAAAACAEERPRRVVSLNLCTDELLLLLADREQIASVTFLAADPDMSVYAEETRGVAVNHGLAEQVLPLDPDLVLADPYTASFSVELLRELGYPIVTVTKAESLDEIRRNIRTIARALGQEARGEAVIARFEARLEALSRAVAGRPVLDAVLLEAGGITYTGKSLVNEILDRARISNLLQEEDGGAWRRLSLEDLLWADPDMVVIGREGRAPALKTALFDHPALDALEGGDRLVSVPGNLWACGGPQVIEALEMLVAARARFEGGS